MFNNATNYPPPVYTTNDQPLQLPGIPLFPFPVHNNYIYYPIFQNAVTPHVIQPEAPPTVAELSKDAYINNFMQDFGFSATSDTASEGNPISNIFHNTFTPSSPPQQITTTTTTTTTSSSSLSSSIDPDFDAAGAVQATEKCKFINEFVQEFNFLSDSTPKETGTNNSHNPLIPIAPSSSMNNYLNASDDISKATNTIYARYLENRLILANIKKHPFENDDHFEKFKTYYLHSYQSLKNIRDYLHNSQIYKNINGIDITTRWLNKYIYTLRLYKNIVISVIPPDPVRSNVKIPKRQFIYRFGISEKVSVKVTTSLLDIRLYEVVFGKRDNPFKTVQDFKKFVELYSQCKGKYALICKKLIAAGITNKNGTYITNANIKVIIHSVRADVPERKIFELIEQEKNKAVIKK